jgi:prophage DNA circulation protein
MERDFRDAVTKPTLDTVLERINAIAEDLSALRTEMRKDLRALRDEVAALRIDVSNLRKEFQLFRAEVEIGLDRANSMTNLTRSELLTLRSDFNEFRTQQKDI